MLQFATERIELKERLREMGRQVASSVSHSIRCLQERNEDLAHRVLRDEAIINRSEIQIDDYVARLIALYQPVAADMRLLVAALKINTDLERMGDLAVNIVERALVLITLPALEPNSEVARMSPFVQAMVLDSLESFVREDAELARKILLADDQVDEWKNATYRNLTERMKVDPQSVDRAVRLMFVAHNLERIADHATNIAEDVIFLVEGVDVRHRAEQSGTAADGRSSGKIGPASPE